MFYFFARERYQEKSGCQPSFSFVDIVRVVHSISQRQLEKTLGHFLLQNVLKFEIRSF